MDELHVELKGTASRQLDDALQQAGPKIRACDFSWASLGPLFDQACWNKLVKTLGQQTNTRTVRAACAGIMSNIISVTQNPKTSNVRVRSCTWSRKGVIALPVIPFAAASCSA